MFGCGPATKRTSKSSLRRSTRINGGGTTVALPPLSPLKKKKKQRDKKTKSSKKETKKRKDTTPPPPAVSPDPVRCSLCMEWFQALEEEIYAGSVWTCATCRSIPAVIMEVQQDLKAALQTNHDLVQSLAAKMVENDELRKENVELRAHLNKSTTKTVDSGNHLVISDTLPDNVTSVNIKTEIVTEQDLTLAECKMKLTNVAKNNYKKVTIAVGRSDCLGNATLKEITNNLKQVVHQAKALSQHGEVQVSSVLPCMHSADSQVRVEQVNSVIADLCKDSNVGFVNNDPCFRLADGEVNDGFFEADGVNLNTAGCNKLIKTLNLVNQVQVQAKSWAQAAQRNKPKRAPQVASKTSKTHQAPLQQKAPCFNCGEPHHTSNLCHYKFRLTCHKCGKLGHKSSRCGNH